MGTGFQFRFLVFIYFWFLSIVIYTRFQDSVVNKSSKFTVVGLPYISEKVILSDSVPKEFREFPFETEIFEKYSRVEQANLTAVTESYLQGVSIRRVEKIMTALGAGGISASSVSRIAKELDEKVCKFFHRIIGEE